MAYCKTVRQGIHLAGVYLQLFTGNLTALKILKQRGVVMFASGHHDISTGHGNLGGRWGAVLAEGLHATDYPVRHDYAVKAEFASQHVLNQTSVLGSMGSVEKIVGSHDELDDPMLCQDNEKAYVALAVARGCNAVFSNIVYKTSEWNAQLWKPQPAVCRKPVLQIASGGSACGHSYNLIFRSDADGFAAKITLGEGNVFDQCVSAYNADDGWDLFAKVSMGQLGSVTVRNCVTYRNGYLRVKEGSSPTSFTLAAITCDDNGTLSIEPSPQMQAGNGNGFKLGGSNLPGGHRLINSISFENLAKGIDSNSCPDIKVENCVSFNNEECNVGFYTENGSAVTEYRADGVVSFRTDKETFDEPELLGVQSQNLADIVGKSNFYWEPSKKLSMNNDGVCVEESWFESLDTSVLPERNPDGSINMHGLLLLKKEVSDKYRTGVTALEERRA